MPEKKSAVWCLLLAVLVSTVVLQAQNKKSGTSFVCTEPNPETLCTADNTCGSDGACSVDIKKDVGISVTPSVRHAKKNQLFCVKAGTKVTFDSSSKNTGFVLDFGSKVPFDRDDAIVGGNKKPDSATVTNPGCYRFSVGACVSGGSYGMCSTQMTEMVVTK
ncbi:MAG TPA: hypothetical protein VMU28_01925 [Terriglobales bacterium]|nr:hypothetical protein [Terriglobales bacterium]